MILGIDLGTTNSAVGLWTNEGPVLIPNSLGDLLTPSAVSIADDGALLVGMAARERQVTHPQMTATTFKRYMGSTRSTRLGSLNLSPEELSSLVLRSLKADAETYLGDQVDKAVITVPAYFSDRQRKATVKAGQLAGLNVERLVNEPTAAALAYGIQNLEEETPFLMFDLGGGTFDVSLIQIFDGVVEVRASAGDNRLGGEDFNDALIALAVEKLQDPRVSDQAGGVLRQTLRAAAERTRRALSDADQAAFAFVWRDQSYQVDIWADDFERQVSGLIDRLRAPVLQALRDGSIKAEQLGEIVLVGGATRMPIIRKAVTRMFGRFPSNALHPDHAIALGAAVQAGLRSKGEGLDEIRMTDVCPYTLGIDVGERLSGGRFRSGLFQPIIERNTVVPASRMRSFTTISDNQTVVRFGVYQGEAREVASNIELGSVSIAVPPKAAGHVEVQCRFSYDISGLLEVDILVPETGEARQLVIVDDGTPGEALDARRRVLADLKIHPRDEDANAAVLARAARCYEAFIGEERAFVAQLISMFQAALDDQDHRVIAKVRSSVEAALNQLEGERYL